MWDDVAVEPVGLRAAAADGPARRFYITGMLGPSFQALAVSAGGDGVTAHDGPLAAGGAVGLAFERANGRLRIETEGMGRGTAFGELGSFGPLTIGLETASTWSVMENVWRDVMLTERLGLYHRFDLDQLGRPAHLLQHRDAARMGVAAVDAMMLAIGLRDLIADPHDRVEREFRILQDH